MRALLLAPLIPLASAGTASVRFTTCGHTASSSYAGSYIEGHFTNACGTYGSACTRHPLDVNVANSGVITRDLTYTHMPTNPCLVITTSHSDGWKMCGIQITAAVGGTFGAGGTWSWTGMQWVDNPIESGNYGAPVTTSWQNCVWTHTANTAAPVYAPPATPPPTTGYGGVSGDPFTTDAQGKKVQFFLPLSKEELLLTCADLSLYGRAFGSAIAGDHQQWFNEFRLTRAGADVVKVEVGNSTDIAVAVMNKMMTRTGVVAHDGAEIEVSKKAVDVTVGSTRMQFMSAVASKFATKTQQQQYKHLDVKFAALNTKTCTAGVLAEIWGVAKMSAATMAMLQPAA